MRRRFHFVAFAVALMAPVASSSADDSAERRPPGSPAASKQRPAHLQLRVRVSNLDSDEGRVAVALFDQKRGFPDQKRALRGKLSKIDSQRASVVFRGLEPGTYAVAVLHDANENSKMDFNFLGMPLEGFGFSNDASATFGPPDFEEAAFRLRAKASVIDIKARYLF